MCALSAEWRELLERWGSDLDEQRRKQQREYEERREELVAKHGEDKVREAEDAAHALSWMSVL